MTTQPSEDGPLTLKKYRISGLEAKITWGLAWWYPCHCQFVSQYKRAKKNDSTWLQVSWSQWKYHHTTYKPWALSAPLIALNTVPTSHCRQQIDYSDSTLFEFLEPHGVPSAAGMGPPLQSGPRWQNSCWHAYTNIKIAHYSSNKTQGVMQVHLYTVLPFWSNTKMCGSTSRNDL